MVTKYPIWILKRENQSQLQLVTDLDKLLKNPGNLREDLKLIEIDYSSVIKSIRELISLFSSRKIKDPRVFWLVGDYIHCFLLRLDKLGFYLSLQNFTLSRDIKVSKSTIEKALSFRRRFPDISLINPKIPWSKYRDNKIPPP